MMDFRSKSYRADGVQRVQLEPSTKSSKVYVQGLRWSATLVPSGEAAPKESHSDMTFGTFGDPAIDFQGIEGLWVKDAKDEDYMGLRAMFPNTGTEAQWTALGLGAWPFGAAPTPEDAGQDDVSLFHFGRTIYMPPDGKVPPIVAEGTFTIAAPVFLRFYYYAHGTVIGNDPRPNVVVLCRLWEGL